MRILYLLLIAVFLACDAYASLAEEYQLPNQENKYSIKNLSKHLKTHRKKNQEQYIPGGQEYYIATWDENNKNFKSSTDFITKTNPLSELDQKQDDKGPSHREIIGREHDVLRQKMLNGSWFSPPSNSGNDNINKFIKPKLIDNILPSFKTKIDL